MDEIFYPISNNNNARIHQTTTSMMTTHRTSSNTYASATGEPTSYEKMHGYVSQEPVCWEECVPETEFSRSDAHETDIGRSDLREIKIEDMRREGGKIARITINRPEKRNAFTPKTIKEMQRCFDDARDDTTVGVVVLRGLRRLGVLFRRRSERTR